MSWTTRAGDVSLEEQLCWNPVCSAQPLPWGGKPGCVFQAQNTTTVAMPTKIGEYAKHYLDKIALPPKARLRKMADSALPIAGLLDFASLSNKRPTP